MAKDKTQRFNIVYADPPWQYSSRRLKYATMTLDELKKLERPLSRVCHEDCALLMWVTMPKLPEGIALIEAWGFRYVTCFVTWVKVCKSEDKPVFGTGYYTRSNAELCLLGLKGNMSYYRHPLPEHVAEGQKPRSVSSIMSNVRSVANTHHKTPVLFQRRSSHSRKPEDVPVKIEQVFGSLPRLELFAREVTPGYTCIGNELVAKCDEHEMEYLQKCASKKKRRISLHRSAESRRRKKRKARREDEGRERRKKKKKRRRT